MVAKEKKVKRNGIPQKMALIMNALLVVVKTRTYFSECTMATLCLEMMHGYQPKRRNVREGVGRCYSNISVALIYKHAAVVLNDNDEKYDLFCKSVARSFQTAF